jgi:hypothetical protein
MGVNEQMDDFIRAAHRKTGVVDRVRAAGEMSEDRRDRVYGALADVESAIQHGDDLDRKFAERRLDRVIDEARAARQKQAEPAAPRPTSTAEFGARSRARAA